MTKTKLYSAMLTLGLATSGYAELSSAALIFESADGAGLSLPDNDPAGVSSSIVVADEGTILDDFVLNLDDFEHTWVGDLIGTLEHEDSGTVVSLFDRPGQGGVGTCSTTFGCSINLAGSYFFSSDAATDFEAAVVAAQLSSSDLAPGGYLPQESLDAFNGLSLMGTWTLTLSDNAAGDGGGISGWSFSALVEANEVPTPSPLWLMLPMLGYLGWRQRPASH